MSERRFDTSTIAGCTTLWVESGRIDECVRHYLENHLDSLGINPVRGYSDGDISFLRRHPSVTDVTIVNPPRGPFDLEPIRALRGLHSLTVSGPAGLSMREFPALEVLRANWDPKLDLAGCDRLAVLDLSGFRSKHEDLSDLPDLPALRDLSLVQARIRSLHGLGRFPKLTRLQLAYLPKLESLAEIGQLPLLEVLECERCKRLRDHEVVRAARRLRRLRLSGCGTMPTLGFIREMPQLEDFSFVDTTVADGDLRPLLKLKRVGFLRKKHYSHTPEQLAALLGAGETGGVVQ